MTEALPEPDYDPALIARLAEVITGETARYCGPGWGTCGSVTVEAEWAPDLVWLILDALPWPKPDPGRPDSPTTSTGA